MAVGPTLFTRSAGLHSDYRSLTIHDRFYPFTLKRRTSDVGNIRVIDFDNDRDWRPFCARMALPRALSRGPVQVASGKTVRLYRADGTRLVLLPPKG